MKTETKIKFAAVTLVMGSVTPLIGVATPAAAAPGLSNYSIRHAFGVAWRNETAYNRRAMCTGWRSYSMRSAMLQVAAAPFESVGVPAWQGRSVLRRFFNRKCY